MALYDRNWTPRQDLLSSTSHFSIFKQPIPKPEKFDEMLEISRILSADHPQMRVDLYYVDNKIYFGELTLTSACGFMTYFNNEGLAEMGSLIKIDNN